MKLSAIKVDTALTEQGDWVDSIPELPGIRIKARGANNGDYRRLQAKLLAQIPRGARLEGLPPEDQDRIVGRLLLETVVLDVQGLENEDGSPLPWSRAVGEQLLLEPAFKVFREGAAHAGEVVAQRRKAGAESDVKN
jgi:hypothetical protein